MTSYDRKSEPPAEQNDMLLVRLYWSAHCPDVWVVFFYFSIKSPCIVQLRQSCVHCWHRWYKPHQDCPGSPIVESQWWPPDPIDCLDQACPLKWNIPGIVYYIIWHRKQGARVIFDGYNQQFSTKSEERAMRNIKENLWKHLDGSKYANYISAGRFSEQCQEQMSSDKVPDQIPEIWLSRCPTSKIRCCFHCHICALGVLDAQTVVMGSDRLVGGSNCHGPSWCSTLPAPAQQ